MQIRIFSIPVLGGEKLNDEMNQFLRSKRVLQVEDELVTNGGGTFWCFCIKYLDDTTRSGRKKVDYRKVLDKVTFNRFSAMRETRKKLAGDEGIPAYAILTDEQLAEMAASEILDEAAMRAVEGVGDKKIEKYGKHFYTVKDGEKSQ